MNKQTKYLRKHGMCSHNNGAYTTVTPVNHGVHAFQEPAVAMERKKRNNVRTWKTTKRHPSHPSNNKTR
jgi:hypothetical protein